jgi:hypothetical protein
MDEVEAAMRGAGFVDVVAKDVTPAVARSAEQMKGMASNSLLLMKLGRALDAPEDAIYEGHVRAAVAASEGLLTGGITYGVVSGTRPQR